MRKTRTELERFLALTLQRDFNECWLWPAAKDAQGNGVFRRAPRKWTSSTSAARWIYEQTRDVVWGDEHIVHTCGNNACINPDHLRCVSVRQHCVETGIRRRVKNFVRDVLGVELRKTTVVQ